MAEVVGVVTGGAGLLSLSIQLLESARKLEQFYSNVRGEYYINGVYSNDVLHCR